MIFLNPRTDIAFKKLFGDEHRKNLTISFLNSVLELQEGLFISEISFRDGANIPDTIDQKKTFVDINCIDQAGNHYIIEMQIVPQKAFIARALYYSSLVFSRQLAPRIDYEKLVPVVFLEVLDHTLFTDHNDAISHYLFTNTKNGLQLEKKYLQLHFIELPKFQKKIDELITETDKWLYFLKNAEELQAVPASMQQSKEFQEAFHVVAKMGWSDDEFETYITELDLAGKEDRIKAAGHDQGRQETQTLIAINALKKGLDFELIASISGLSIEEIKKLSANLKIIMIFLRFF